MKRILPLAFALALSAPAFAQTADSQGAKELSDNLARYFGKQAFDKGVLKVSVEGDAYRIALDIKALVNALPEQKLLKFDMAPYALMVKPRSDGSWDVSSNFSQGASFEFDGPQGHQSMDFTIKDGKLTSVYDPALAAFTNATSSLAGMTMSSREAKQQADVSTGAGTATVTATKSADGGVDFTATQKVSNFVEMIKVTDPDNGMNFPLTLKTPELSADANGKGVRTKPLLDLLAFAVANEDEAKLKANQAELKSLMLAALPIWQRIDGNYGFKDFMVESPIGEFGAKQFSTAFGMDGVSQNGKVDYTIKASGLTIPHQTLPEWTTPLLPTDIDLNFGGANIDLDTMARKTIEAFDLNKNPPLPDEFGKALVNDFKAKKPKIVFGHSTVKNGDIEVAMEGEVFFPDSKKPDGSVTIDIGGYDKIVDALKEAAKSDEQMAQAFPFALAVKGFGKTLPDGRLEWVIETKADGSVKVNGAMLKGPDEVQDDNSGGDDGSNGTDDSTGGDDSDGGDNGGAGAKLQP